MRLTLRQLIPLKYDRGYFNDLWGMVQDQVNSLTEGRISAVTNATTAAPTTGSYKQGDFVRNSTPTEAGSAGSKYVLLGWVCVSSGSPGTWKEARVLTGN